MWFYNQYMQRWYHSLGITSDNPPDAQPTQEQLDALLEIRKKTLDERKNTSPHAPLIENKDINQSTGGCNCGSKKREAK